MKKLIVLLLILLAVINFSLMANASTFKGYWVAAKSEKEGITIFAKMRDGIYIDFKIDFKGRVFSRPFWINVTNPIYAPQIIYENINHDKKEELIIILTRGYGTGVLDEEVHVLDTHHNLLREVLVDNPIAIINKNVKTKLSPTIAEIRIGDRTSIVDLKPLGIRPENLFDDIYFGNIIKYEVTDNQLIVNIAAQISPAGGFLGEVVIVYEYRDKMYQAKSIKFESPVD